MAEKFNLKWHDFNTNVSKSFGLLRDEEYLHDVTLVSDDNMQVSAHKLVLSACSEYFKNIFRNNNKHQHPLICLDGLSSTEVSKILDYIYNGEVEIFQDDLDRFLAVAQKLKLEGLLGGKDNDKSEEKTYEDISYKEEEEEMYETYVITADTEKKVTRKAKQQTHKISGTVSLNGNEMKGNIKHLDYYDKLPDKSFKCKICGNTANYLTHIKNHVETHMEGLSFSCQICEKTFRSRNSLSCHKSIYHK